MTPAPPIPTESSGGSTEVLVDVSSARASAERGDGFQRELPLEVKRAAVSGLGVASIVGAGVAASYIVVLMLVAHRASLGAPLGTYVRLLLPVLALDLLAFTVTRVARAEPDVVIRFGLVHFVVVAFLLGLVRYSGAWADGEAVRQWQPVAVWIVLFGALVPLRPGTLLGWGLFAALMDPLALLVASRMGASIVADRLLLMSSPVLGAVMAFVVSSVVYGLNERIAKAREFGSYRLVEKRSGER